MTFLVDTDWVADWLKGQRDAVQVLARLAAQDRLAVSIITYGEVYDGIYHGHDAQRHERGFRQFLRSVDVLPLNRATMRRFAQIRGALRSQGRGIPDPDILIAATAIEHRASLLTRNRRHFERIPNLRSTTPFSSCQHGQRRQLVRLRGREGAMRPALPRLAEGRLSQANRAISGRRAAAYLSARNSIGEPANLRRACSGHAHIR